MARRQVSIFINGKEVANSIKSIAAEKRKAYNELAKLTRGTAEYNAKVKEVKKLNGILSDHRKAIRGVGSTWDKMKGAVGKFAAIAGVSLAADAIIDYGKELFRLGAEMEVLSKKAATVFGEALPQVTEQAEKNATAMGLTTSQYIDAAAAMGDLLIPMQFTREEAANISTNLVDLSGALSEWTGGQRSAEEVSKILSKALLGEREQLKELGIAINEADVKTRLAEKGVKNLTGAQLQQAKAAATLELITEKTADAQAAYAENSDTSVRKQAELAAKFQDIKETLATALIPVFNRLLDVAVPLVSKFSEFIKNLITGTPQTAKLSAVMKVLGTVIGNVWKVMSALHKANGRMGSYIFKKLEPIISRFTSTLLDMYNVVVKGVNRFNEFAGIEMRLEPIDVESIQSTIKEAQEKANTEKIEVDVEPKTSGFEFAGTGGVGSGKNNNAQKEANALQKKLDRLKGIIEKHQNDINLSALSEDEKRLEQIRQKYQKEIDAAVGFNEQIKELERLRDLELHQVQDEIAEKNKAKRAEAKLEIDAELMTEQEAELFAIETHYNNLLALAEQHGFDTSELKQRFEDEKAALDQQYKDQEVERQRAANDEKVQLQYDLFQAQQEVELARVGLYSTIADQIAGIASENESLQNSLFLFQKGLAIAEVVISLQSQLAAINLKYAAIPGGIALAAAESVRAKLNAAKSLAVIGGTVVQKFTQKKDGGWMDAVGADDNISYRSKFIGQPTTGMLPNHPVLINSSSGSAVLASERGREYFVSNSALKNPYVMNYVRAIDNIVRTRVPQYAEGGSTGTAISANTLPPQHDDSSLQLVISELNDTLKHGIFALLDDDTIIDIFRKYNQLNRTSGGALGQ